MSTPVLTFFNNKGGVGKTSLVYHLAWMYAELGKTIVVIDLDAQANLTGSFLNESELETIWDEAKEGSTIYQAVKPLTGVGDIAEPILQKINENLYLLPGDVGLAAFEDSLSDEWTNCLDERRMERAFRVVSAFWRTAQRAANQVKADLIMIDIGPNLGAINRSVLLSTDFVVIPLGADLFSLQGLKNLGPTLRNWRSGWQKRLDERKNSATPQTGIDLPTGQMKPIGYLGQQYGSMRNNRPTQAYEKWLNRIPNTYRHAVLNINENFEKPQIHDPYCLATIKHYRSLIPMAQEKRKPVFNLTAADGALGSHSTAAKKAHKDFKSLADKIWQTMHL
ncbi:MAG: ParA family protein [Formosimonas sp.]